MATKNAGRKPETVRFRTHSPMLGPSSQRYRTAFSGITWTTSTPPEPPRPVDAGSRGPSVFSSKRSRAKRHVAAMVILWLVEAASASVVK